MSYKPLVQLVAGAVIGAYMTGCAAVKDIKFQPYASLDSQGGVIVGTFGSEPKVSGLEEKIDVNIEGANHDNLVAKATPNANIQLALINPDGSVYDIARGNLASGTSNITIPEDYKGSIGFVNRKMEVVYKQPLNNEEPEKTETDSYCKRHPIICWGGLTVIVAGGIAAAVSGGGSDSSSNNNPVVVTDPAGNEGSNQPGSGGIR